jgi:hypothetical protein
MSEQFFTFVNSCFTFHTRNDIMVFMSKNHENNKKSRARVSEPVQVYLGRKDADRLARLTDELETTKSDILRRGLAALEREIQDPSRDPVLRLIGLVENAEESTEPGYDVAGEHDRFLADTEESSWSAPDSKK